jgi:hypothetical protein
VRHERRAAAAPLPALHVLPAQQTRKFRQPARGTLLKDRSAAATRIRDPCVFKVTDHKKFFYPLPLLLLIASAGYSRLKSCVRKTICCKESDIWYVVGNAM